MKTYNHLIGQAVSDELMEAALKSATRGKMTRPNILDVSVHKKEVMEKIKRWMLSGEYPYQMHEAFIKFDTHRQKPRTIVQPYFTVDYPEQWIQHIVVKILQPIILRGAYFHSYASLPNKGSLACMKALSSYIRKNSCSVRYFLKTDIKGFYEHINPNILKEKFRRIIKDKLFLKAIYWIIDNNRYALPTGEVVSKGLTIGAYSSQWFANFYLQDFDHYVKEQLGAKFYIRYMDDMIILDSNKKHLHEIKKKMIEFLDKEKLFFKPNYTVQKLNYTKPDGKVSGSFIEFIGYRFYREKTTLRRSLFYRATRLARRVHEHIKKVKKLLKKDASAVVAYYGWFKHADCYKAYQKYISPIISINACKRLIGYLARYKKRKGVRVLNNEDEG